MRVSFSGAVPESGRQLELDVGARFDLQPGLVLTISGGASQYRGYVAAGISLVQCVGPW